RLPCSSFSCFFSASFSSEEEEETFKPSSNARSQNSFVLFERKGGTTGGGCCVLGLGWLAPPRSARGSSESALLRVSLFVSVSLPRNLSLLLSCICAVSAGFVVGCADFARLRAPAE